MSEDEYLCSLSHSDRFEFDDGVVTAKRGPDMPQRDHVDVATELTLRIVPYARSAGGYAGQATTTNLSDSVHRRYRIPDFAYWAPGRPVGESIYQPPTIAFEVVPPDQDLRLLRQKCRDYIAAGIAEAWLIHPGERWAEVWDASRDGTRLDRGAALESVNMPGFRLPLRDLFDVLRRDD
jgi:Uma2 family endonuclease